MMHRLFLTGAFLLVTTASLAAPPPANPEEAAAFMNHLWTRASEVLNKKEDATVRQARFRELFHDDFDGLGIARFVLGRYWRTASEEERQEFVKLFENYVVFVYTARLGDFGGQKFKIRGTRSDGDGAIVSTDVMGPGNSSPLRIDWRLVSDNGAYKINDVIVDGVSMMVTQRAEFASVVQRNGGQVRGLIALMRQKTANAAR
ncbi:MAG: ABC transporter substrate-binding protein [Alphaproteobacteria bacterium]|nr:ABC transporter substrate-binding protein [Alphaproteobacteria bacterium]